MATNARWFRFHTGTVNLHKAQSLSGELFKFWVNCLCLAACGDGELPDLEQMAFSLRIAIPKVKSQRDALVAKNLIDQEGDRFKMHDWDEWQFQSDVSNERVKRYRERKRNASPSVTGNVTVTPSEQNRADTDSEQSRVETLHPTAELPDLPESALEPWEQFRGWFTGPVEGDAWRCFGATVSTPGRLSALMHNGPLWMRHKRYADGYHSAIKFLRSEVWLSPPKAPTPTEPLGEFARLLRGGGDSGSGSSGAVARLAIVLRRAA